jgi:hypothetical protein
MNQRGKDESGLKHGPDIYTAGKCGCMLVVGNFEKIGVDVTNEKKNMKRMIVSSCIHEF